MIVKTSAARQVSIRVSVSLVVSGFLHGINCGGSEFVDGLEDAWEADRAYSSGGYGYVQRGTMRSPRQAISGTEDDGLYQSQRENACAYRFDNVPNGTYQLDLNLAEIQRVRFGQRLVDVIVEDETLLPAHDIAYEVGTFAAEPNRFQPEPLLRSGCAGSVHRELIGVAPTEDAAVHSAVAAMDFYTVSDTAKTNTETVDCVQLRLGRCSSLTFVEP